MTTISSSPKTDWWIGSVGYEVYIRSFQDSNGDGVGDLPGITSRLDYLAWLGVDALWMTPFMVSPGFDHGYDVSDYTDINPIHGTLADFDDLVEQAHRLGLRVIVDIVPNHSSSHHPWFREALRGKDSPYRDYYLWRDPGPDGGPPNNWVSHFGGPAWTLDEASGQYYCHLFLPEQPDLNWENEAVRAEFDEILRFWMDRGADGFRVDVAQGLIKASDFADNPQLRPIVPGMSNWDIWSAFDHLHDIDQDLNLDVFRRWNRVVEPYGAMLLAEIGGVSDPARVARYTNTRDSFHGGFFLDPPQMSWEPARLIEITRAMHEAESEAVSWVIDNHDRPRSASRFGGGAAGARRSLVLMTLYLSLGGSPYLYQGQELGIEDGRVAPRNLEDPIATRNEFSVGRDGTRTAMPWEPGPGNGFTTGTPWLEAVDRDEADTVAGQRDDPSSMLSKHRELLAVRRRNPDLWEAGAEWRDAGSPDVAVLVRGEACLVANLGPADAAVDLPDGRWGIVFDTSGSGAVGAENRLVLSPESAVILVRS